ncbi:extracellular matrix regulator RemB [Bacillus thermotolerans]|uniref:DUF370 domain-containing protein n=1 Tax=Bacillus thermotolerans TaxID=1221996 RepID=A0A0F5I232_BACTR|nr:extracellular matrix/biofilm biosynthesis regulator RemA family protein [Bacillus thermotolerans]KKB37478.1 hypothetical protein QY97_00333 [Bacillus thermotolerans]KKB39533.1 hypothetical protein QY95_02381 [Bacillus thermotolerans]KKB44170.1 hypothetical protein QY96_03796 [Bacillus thermotolerans]
MYVQISESDILRTSDIVAIIDQHSLELSKESAVGYLSEEDVSLLTAGHYKSVIITTNSHYLSPFSSHTLKKRVYENHP